MKKFLTLILAVCAVSLTSCEKNTGNGTDSLTGTLTGTQWTQNIPDEEDENVIAGVITYTFAETTVKGVMEFTDGTEGGEINGVYTYNAPNVTITLEEEEAVSGVVEGNTMTLTSVLGTIVLTKKQN